VTESPDTVAKRTVLELPTTRHIVGVGQDTPLRLFVVTGVTAVADHVEPDSVTTSASPEFPTTRHKVDDPQLMAFGVPLETAPLTGEVSQDEPPFDEMFTSHGVLLSGSAPAQVEDEPAGGPAQVKNCWVSP
jgi:hypothetical protein